MKFNQKSFEVIEAGKTESIEKVCGFIAENSERLRKEGVPVDNDCRLDMEAFLKIYGDNAVENDRRLIKEYEAKWHPDIPAEDIAGKKKETSGEKLEILITALFAKFLGDKFIVVRSSLYDDVKNGIDNVVLEKESGTLICAFDEIANISDSDYEEKRDKILTKNRKGGVKLKYGIKIKDDKVKLAEGTGVPIFYLALPEKHLEEGIKEFMPSFGEKSEYEINLFKYFLSSIENQYRLLELERKLDPSLKERLILFKRTIDQFKELV